METFCNGDWVIDTRRKDVGIIRAIIPDSYPTLYVLEDADEKRYYISDGENLIHYYKEWFSENE